MTPQTTERLREAMRRVVADSTGTGRSCRVPGWTVAAKTGTAENPHGKPHSWFMGYAPTEKPEVAFSVIVEAGGHGSDVALPIARTILRRIHPEPPKETPPNTPAPAAPVPVAPAPNAPAPEGPTPEGPTS